MTVISMWSFDFDKVEVDAVSTAGTPYKRRVCVGMPKIPPQVLDCSFYLYETVEQAKRGTEFGGTGFFIGYPTDRPEQVLPYAVTNKHVAVRDGFSVIRINKIGGGTDIFDFDASEWEFCPAGNDLAVITPSLLRLRGDMHQVTTIPVNMFVEKSDLSISTFAAGEDIFMVGRFVDHDGAAKNVPAARFGNISTLPQIIAQPTGAKDLESFILDIHSRTGYSGSPVFVYRTHGSDLTTNALNVSASGHFIKLLGLHWGQFPEKWELKDKEKKKEALNEVAPLQLSDNEKYVEGWSGMTLAIPAWAIREFLDRAKFARERGKIMDQLKQANGDTAPVAESSAPASPASAESVAPRTNDANPKHREDFMRLVGEAARKPRQ
jgi:hypothetical protein